MNTDQIKGKIEQAVGHVKQGFGETVGDNKTANEGVADQVKGAAQETWGNAKDAAKTGASTKEAEATNRSSSIRQDISDKVESAKNAVNEKIDEYKATHNR